MLSNPSEEIELMSSSVSLSGQVFVGVEILDNYIHESELVLKPRGIDMFQGKLGTVCLCACTHFMLSQLTYFLFPNYFLYVCQFQAT